MNPRAFFKRCYYTYWPPARGALRYFGSRIYFPFGSHLFHRVCEEGIYEERNVRSILALVRRDQWYFDVGANLGLMAAPVLREFPSVQVVSFEPSPAALKYLRRTVETSPYRERWKLVEKALSSTAGARPFFTADEANSAYDGLANTRRGSDAAAQTTVHCSTLDEEWISLGRPEVSLIKIDVEGAELAVLEGATECVRTSRPSILLEWNRHNLLAHGVEIESILRWAKEREYHLHSAETGALVTGPEALRWHMAFGENFLLFPVRE